jgi:hypothetical protein
MDAAERLLWCWTVAILAFFSFSRFKLDHYIFPAAPALCLLCARAWAGARAEADSIGARVGVRTIGLLLVIAGIAVWLLLDRVPLTLSGFSVLLPIALILGGLASIARIIRARPGVPAAPLWPIATLVAGYAVVILVALPAFEEAKPIGRLAQTVAAHIGDNDAIGMFRLNRWSGSWRYYVNRHTVRLETLEDVMAFFSMPGGHYCAMPRSDFDELVGLGMRLHIIYEQEGLFTTTGRNLRAGARARRERFVVDTNDTAELNESPTPAM